ncbi:MAG: TetR/AcrR family transcriptional regulator [Gemmatimonadales bacterium]
MPTRERLIQAARRLFAERGLDRTSIRAITREAEANLGAVTYHFGSKEKLEEAVLDQVFGSMADRVGAASAAGARATERLAGVVHALFDFFEHNPDAPRLMIHLLVAVPPSATAPPPAVVVHQRRTLQAITDVVQAGVAAGEFRPVDPLLVAFSVVSQPVWFAIVRRFVAAISGVPMDRADQIAAVEHHIVDVVTRALVPA